MKPAQHDRLLRDAVAGDAIERLRTESLAQMLGAARQRRRCRTMLSGVAASIALVMTALVLTHRDVRPLAMVPPPTVNPADAGVKIISDQQLLALFPHRSIALIGAPGEQRLLFLDKVEPGSAREARPR